MIILWTVQRADRERLYRVCTECVLVYTECRSQSVGAGQLWAWQSSEPGKMAECWQSGLSSVQCPVSSVMAAGTRTVVSPASGGPITQSTGGSWGAGVSHRCQEHQCLSVVISEGHSGKFFVFVPGYCLIISANRNQRQVDIDNNMFSDKFSMTTKWMNFERILYSYPWESH